MSDEIKQNQKAGANSQQTQIQNLTIINGIDEKRAREIFSEMYAVAKTDLTSEAINTANERIKNFENVLIPKMEKINGALNAFADPSFQVLLAKANKSAACSNQDSDYELLSQLLIHRVEKRDSRKDKAGINRAVEIDPQAMQKISKNDKKRIFRVLEIYHSTGKNKTAQEVESRINENPYDYIVFAIDMQRERLYDRINRRVDIMLESGLVDEVKSLINKYEELPTAIQGLGYKEVVSYLENEITYDEMVEKIKQETRRYAKRQLTWFRRNKKIIWLNGLDDIQNNINIILKGVEGE